MIFSEYIDLINVIQVVFSKIFPRFHTYLINVYSSTPGKTWYKSTVYVQREIKILKCPFFFPHIIVHLIN